MTAVLDQFEVEYKESYISGSYDQVVMGNMINLINSRGQKKYVYGERGVVYSSIESYDAPTPGTTVFDRNDSASYRLQPYKEKAGNCRAAKHICYEERIHDTLLPDPLSCFKINGAQPTVLSGTWRENPGFIPRGYLGLTPSAIDENNAFLMFDNLTDSTYPRSRLNSITDSTWTNSFPFEPRYSAIKRNINLNFNSIKAKYRTIFSSSLPLPAGPNVASIPNQLMPTVGGIIFGTIGPHPDFTWIGSYSNSISYSPPFAYHHWFADTKLSKLKTLSFLGSRPVTGSLSYNDDIKVLFGFGDGTTVHYDKQFINSNDPTGYQRRGTKNLPTFRSKNFTLVDFSILFGVYGTYYSTGSVWNTSPIIRGWKYGIHNGLPDYTHSYYRQGKYGQFRDMLEQRRYTSIINEKTSLFDEGVVHVKFLDQDENLTNPINTQSQNLSLFATSSLPYFDLEQRNRPVGTLQVNNLQLVNLKFDTNSNLRI